MAVDDAAVAESLSKRCSICYIHAETSESRLAATDARLRYSGGYTIADFGELFSVSRPTVYRTLSRVVAP